MSIRCPNSAEKNLPRSVVHLFAKARLDTSVASLSGGAGLIKTNFRYDVAGPQKGTTGTVSIVDEWYLGDLVLGSRVRTVAFVGQRAWIL